MKSDLEEAVAFQIRALRLPVPVQEFAFHPERKWRFDFAWPDRKIAIEVEGGVWVQGRHTRGASFIADCDKYNAATLMGWRVYRLTGNHIKNNGAMDLLQKVLA